MTDKQSKSPTNFIRQIIDTDLEQNKNNGKVATRFPPGIRLYAWNDESLSIRGRLTTLTKSLLQGCLLVFILLGLFLGVR